MPLPSPGECKMRRPGLGSHLRLKAFCLLNTRTAAPGELRLCFLLHEHGLCRRGCWVALCQRRSLWWLGSHGPHQCRLWIAVGSCSRHIAGSVGIVCHVPISRAHAWFVCCVPGLAGSPRAAGPPRCSRSQGEPDLGHADGVSSRAMCLLAALHIAGVSQAKIRQALLASGLETACGKGNAI